MMDAAQVNDIETVIQGPGDVEWKYEMRREAQEILPGLYLGPFMASKSMETLKKLNITHIICVRDLKESFSVKPRFENDFKYLTLDVEDNEEQNLIRVFPQAKEFIDNALNTGGRVLVHCNGGISLSPSFVVMYVMQYYKITWEDSLHLVQNRRYCVSPNGGFLTQIKEYEAIYKANQALASFPAAARRVSRRKREDDKDETEDERWVFYHGSLILTTERHCREEDRKRAWLSTEPERAWDPNAMETL